MDRPPISPAIVDAPHGADLPGEREPFLVALGERVRMLRARKGLTRKALSRGAGVSERHLANLELGLGNASILVLRQVAQALSCSLAELLGDETTASPEWLLIRDLLAGEPSILMRPELYVTAAALAAGLFVVLTLAGLAVPVAALIAAVAGFALRGAAISRGWSLPAYRD